MARTFEIEGIKRMSHNWNFIAGADFTKRDLNASLFSTNPNTIIFENNIPGSHYWDWTGKLIGGYQFPWGVMLNTSFRSQKGEGSTRTINVNCDRLLSAGQTCAQAGGAAPRQGSISAQVVEREGVDGNFYPTLTLWDFGVKKSFNISEFGRLDAQFDLFNLLNANTVRTWNTASSTTKTLLDGTVVPNFHVPTGILNARIFRIGMRWAF
jgi:hypothetical protein